MTIDMDGKTSRLSYQTLLFICCMVTFICYFGSYMRIPVVPLFAKTFGADTAEVGMINSSFLLMAGLLSLPLGILSDRVGRKLLIFSGLFISALSSFLLYFSSSTQQLIWIYALFGIGLAAFAPTMMSFVADFSPVTHLGRSYGWYTLAIYGGMSLGPAFGGMTAQWYGFLPVFLASGILVFCLCGVVFFFLPRARHVLVNRPPRRETLVVARELVKNTPLLACWLVTLGGCFGLGMFITFIPLHAQARGIGIGAIGVIFATQAVCNALSRIPFGQLSDKVAKRSNLVIVGLIGFALCMFGFGLARNLLFFILFSGGLGISMGIAFTAVGALISEVVSADSRGLAMGGYNSCIYIGMMLSSLVMGVAIERIGFQNSFFVVAAVNLAATGLFYLIFNGAEALKAAESTAP